MWGLHPKTLLSPKNTQCVSVRKWLLSPSPRRSRWIARFPGTALLLAIARRRNARSPSVLAAGAAPCQMQRSRRLTCAGLHGAHATHGAIHAPGWRYGDAVVARELLEGFFNVQVVTGVHRASAQVQQACEDTSALSR